MAKKTQEVKKFWENQAKEFKSSHLATAPDTYYRELEINQINNYLHNGKKIVDVGCGNGYSTIRFARKYPKSTFIGIDYSEEMVKYAMTNLAKEKSSVRKRIKFFVGDVKSLSKHPELQKSKFDYVVSERCLINLLSWKEQQRALLELKYILKKGGQVILCENTQEGLARLNKLRKSFGLFEIKVRWHNYYMPQEKLLAFAKKKFKIEEVTNIGSMYYIISRVVYAKYADIKKENPDYLHPLNKIAAELPILGEYSPNYIFLLKNK